MAASVGVAVVSLQLTASRGRGVSVRQLGIGAFVAHGVRAPVFHTGCEWGTRPGCTPSDAYTAILSGGEEP